MSVTLSQNISQAELRQLWAVAQAAIGGLFTDEVSLPPQLALFPRTLTQPGACFVTLEVGGQLQGCLGSVSAQSPLILDVYHKARASACEDRRFSPLTEAQLEALSIEVSVLSQPERLDVDAESALVAFLSEHKVGVIVSEHTHRALFLPQVWESLPDPQDFLRHLKVKAGWGAGYWSSGIEVKIFTVTSMKRKYDSSEPE